MVEASLLDFLFGGPVAALDDECSMTYGELKAALLKVFSVEDAKASAFKALIENMARVGLFAPEGKGRQREYRQQDALALAIAIRMHSLGVLPSDIAALSRTSAMSSAIESAIHGRIVSLFLHREVFGKWRIEAHDGAPTATGDGVEFSVSRLWDLINRSAAA